MKGFKKNNPKQTLFFFYKSKQILLKWEKLFFYENNLKR